MKINILSGLLLTTFIAFSACKKENNNTPTPTPGGGNNPVKSRDVRYEISGNYSGKLKVTYFQAGGGIGSTPDVTVPWTKEITYQASVGGVNLSAGGHEGGLPGQTVTLKIFVGGVEKHTATGEVGSNGVVSVITDTYVF